MLEPNWYDAQLKSLVGGRITAAAFLPAEDLGGEKVPVLIVRTRSGQKLILSTRRRNR